MYVYVRMNRSNRRRFYSKYDRIELFLENVSKAEKLKTTCPAASQVFFCNTLPTALIVPILKKNKKSANTLNNIRVRSCATGTGYALKNTKNWKTDRRNSKYSPFHANSIKCLSFRIIQYVWKKSESWCLVPRTIGELAETLKKQLAELWWVVHD